MPFRTLRLAVLILNITTVSAHAQDRPRDRPTTVVVTLNGSEHEVQGELLALTDQAVAVVVGGVAQEHPLATVRRVQRLGDSNRDGAIRGAILLALLCTLNCGQGTTSTGHYLGAIAANSAFGALAGWQFDRDHAGRTTLYPFPRGGRVQRPATSRPSIRFGVRF